MREKMTGTNILNVLNDIQIRFALRGCADFADLLILSSALGKLYKHQQITILMPIIH